jgi:hypothetical protein
MTALIQQSSNMLTEAPALGVTKPIRPALPKPKNLIFFNLS